MLGFEPTPSEHECPLITTRLGLSPKSHTSFKETTVNNKHHLPSYLVIEKIVK